MRDEKRRMLVLVEGEKTDITLMKRLLAVYNIDAKYEIVPYRTNIYTLHNELFSENDPSSYDLLQLLKEREPNQELKSIFDDFYTDILLIFDFEPHAPEFSPEKINHMMKYFVESSDMGKLYLTYPMVEAFYHMSSIPDPQHDTYFASLYELEMHEYKSRVNRENRNHDYRKFATTKEECNIVIRQNIGKASMLCGDEPSNDFMPEQLKILAAQLKLLSDEQQTAVLSTCCFLVPEYNPMLIC